MKKSYPERLQQVTPPPPKIIKIQPSKSSAVTPRSWKNVKNENWHIQIGYNRRQHHEIPEMQKIPKCIIHNYNTRSRTKKVNHLTNFKNAPKCFSIGSHRKNRTKNRIRLPCLHRPQRRNNNSRTNYKPHPL